MNVSATEREEGEISDDYEIISDESIDSHTAEKSGKCTLPPQELTPTISLSSVSDNYSDGEGNTFIASRRTPSRKCSKGSKRRVCRRAQEKRRSSYPKPKRKKYSDDSDSESDSEFVNKRIKRQLKEAIRVADNKCFEKSTNSLQTRLQRMINPNYSISKPVLHEEDEEVLALRDIALLSTQKKEEEEIVMKKPTKDEKLNTSTDQELTELRIIALKSAFLKKHQNRKQKKENLDTINTDAVEEDMLTKIEENSSILIEKNDIEVIENHSSISTSKSEEAFQTEVLLTTLTSSESVILLKETDEVLDETKESSIKMKEDSNEIKESSIKGKEDSNEIKECSTKPKDVINEIKECPSNAKEAIDKINVDSSKTTEIISAITVDFIEKKIFNDNKNDSIMKKEVNTHQNENNKEGNEENVEEDEDIMRAMLLASMSKKITSDSKNATNKILKDTVNSVDNKVKNKLVTVLPTAPINKIIININAESDSDNESEQKIFIEKKIDENFDKNLSLLLKQAREKVEKREDSVLDKSDVKLLPRSQQVEYKQLKHKLQMLKARRKTSQKLKRVPIKIDDNSKDFSKKTNALVKKNNKSRTFSTKLKINNVLKNKQLINNKAITATSSQELKRKPQPPVAQERFQDKNRYEELEPLMRQIDEVRKKRDEEQVIVQNLLSQLKIARNRLSSVHQHFTALVQKLVGAKADIDKCAQSHTEIAPSDNIAKLKKALCTSTPNKKLLHPHEENVNLELSVIEPELKTSLPISKEPVLEEANIEMILNIDSKKDTHIDDKIFYKNAIRVEKNVSTAKSTCLTYISPLAHMNNREGFEDPFSIICPYELQGVCRDTECKFQHCAPS